MPRRRSPAYKAANRQQRARVSRRRRTTRRRMIQPRQHTPHDDGCMAWPAGEVVKRRGRRRRRRNARTQRPVSVTVHRTGTGRATELTTYTWASAPTAWDDAAAQMAAQVRKAKRKSEKAAKRRWKAHRESQKERKRTRWQATSQKGRSGNPFDSLPGMAGRTETTRHAQPTIPGSERRRAGMASRGSATSLTPELAAHILKLRLQGQTYREIGEATGHPPSTIRHWIRSGRAAAVVSAGGGGQTSSNT